MSTRQKRGVRWVPVMAAVLLAALCFSAIPATAHDYPKSNHYDGKRFHNPWAFKKHEFLDFLRWVRHREREPWFEVEGAQPGPPPPASVGEDSVRTTFVNHSTFLIQYAGVTFLTDPIWSERASPVSWAGPKRVRPPGIRFDDLPHVDVVLISHNHYDHMDIPTLKRLVDRFHPRIVVPLGNAAYLERNGIHGAEELDWWDGVEEKGVTVTCLPAQHFSSRSLFDHNRALWAGFMLDDGHGPVYFAGDTGAGPFFEWIHDRFGPPRLALLPIGAYKPLWFMGPVHLAPEEAVKVHILLDARMSIGTHWGTFPLADDGRDDPPRDLERARREAGEAADNFILLDFGEGITLPPMEEAPSDDPSSFPPLEPMGDSMPTGSQ